MRIIFWNIRAGGGVRSSKIARQIELWRPDVAALCEFRGTPPSQRLSQRLGQVGLQHQLESIHPEKLAANGLLLASRFPLKAIRLPAAPADPQRWLLAEVGAPHAFTIGVTHVPNYVTGKKDLFREAVLASARNWPAGPGLLIGDTNTGLPEIDEESPVFGIRDARWFEALERCGWLDVFRQMHGDARAYTWYSPNGGNGFRLDQAFANRALLPRITAMSYRWGGIGHQGRRDRLSDHAAILLDLSL